VSAIVLVVSYACFVHEIWARLGPFNGMGYETGFALHGETSPILDGFLYGDALDQPPAEWSTWSVNLRLAEAPAWPAEPVGVAQPATRRMQARTPLRSLKGYDEQKSSLPQPTQSVS
jgi:hypothetical protein